MSLDNWKEVRLGELGDVGSVFLCPTLDKPMSLGNNILLIKSHSNIDK